jgi:4-hydroxy-4-methyl-2-oxoglutarate aldolase
MTPAESLVERLKRLDTCAVSDALDRLGLKGAVAGIAPLWPCPRIAGRAVTVAIKTAESAKPRYHLGTRAIEAARAGEVIVVAGGGTGAAAWGGLLSLAARQKGLSGVVIDGACRDVDASHEAGFPVFARAAVPFTARGRIVEESFNREIDFAGVRVAPGDLVIADGSGVVFVPQAREVEVIEEAEAISRYEAEIAAEIRAGSAIAEVMARRGYETLLEKPE